MEILLVEDNAGDVRLAKEALKDAGSRSVLSVVRDGAEALAFLCRQGKYADAPHPDVILLDLNLPKKDGCAVLAAVKADEALRRIPVIVLTGSRDDDDVLRAYNLRTNCYIVKPVDFSRYIEVLKSVEAFWTTVARLPTQQAA
jgi:two-component system response regulator